MNEVLKMVNLGVFIDYLQEQIEEKERAASAESDPYKQWNLKSQREVLEESLKKYKELVIKQ